MPERTLISPVAPGAAEPHRSRSPRLALERLDPAGPLPIAIIGDDKTPALAALGEALRAEAGRRAHPLTEPQDARLVLNLTDSARPRAHWRRERVQQFGVSLVVVPGLAERDAHGVPSMPPRLATRAPADILSIAYPALIRTLSNAVIAVDSPAFALITPEMGVRPFLAAGQDAGSILDTIVPLAEAVFAIENDVREDLPAELCVLTSATSALAEAGRRLGGLGLLPSVVSFEDFLSDEDRRLLKRIFGLQSLSYGNASVREPSGGFWMTGRGVDKSRLERIGHDMLLVTGVDRSRGVVSVSVPRGHSESRVSVDAIEHALIHESIPSVGAIVHVHAWIDGVDTTQQSWPCGTVELAEEVRDLVARQPHPERAIIGLRNHGLTITGESIDEIFDRVGSRLHRDIPAT